jgi:FMNH2-dependent dimethyl sulfone monooxygenase
MMGDRREINPLYNQHRLKLGTFSSNLSGGCAITTIDRVLQATWPDTLALARMADEMEFEALVPVGRWKGFGGVTNFNGAGFECLSWAAGIAASTSRCGIFSTTHVPTIHPVMAAKQVTTIDHISGGRFALNIVTGWYTGEIDMFGETLMDHDQRYDRALEWLEILKLLWTREEEFDYVGHFYQVRKGWLAPKPLQKPHPVVMCAGGSGKGRDFAARHCDVAFVACNTEDLDETRARIADYRRYAREECGRELMIWSNAYIVQAPTEKEARDFHHHYVYEKGDWEAATNLVETMGARTEIMTPEILRAMKANFIGGWGGYPLIGTRDQIVDGLRMMAGLGLDGTLLSWPRYIEGMREFQTETFPLVKQAGLR